VSEWIAVPREHLRGGRTAPYLITDDDLTAVRAHCEARGATSVEVGFDGAADAGAFIDGLKRVLPFPWWCGSGWDPMLDATEEFADGWPLPVLLIVRGLDAALADDPHLGLEVVVRMEEIADEIGRRHQQLLIVYVADAWPSRRTGTDQS
jgi:hypothetical protein